VVVCKGDAACLFEDIKDIAVRYEGKKIIDRAAVFTAGVLVFPDKPCRAAEIALRYAEGEVDKRI